MTSAEFISKFVYRKGWTFITGWRRVDSEPYAGNCNDFALTTLLSVEGGWLKAIWALLTFRAMFWLTRSPQNTWAPRHVVLWHKDHGWIDSTKRVWRDTPAPHKRRLPLLWPWALFRMLWGGIVKTLVGVGK